MAHMWTMWLWQKENEWETLPFPHRYKEYVADSVTRLATALIKALMIGFQLKSNLSSHIIA